MDFLITKNNKPLLMLEAKISNDRPSESILKFQDALNIPAVQLVKKENIKKVYNNNNNNILVVTAHKWLSALP